MNKVLNWLFDYPALKVYQYEQGFKFSLDSILLAEFANIRKNDEQIIDLCTGNAVIPIVLQQKYNKKIIGIEIQEEVFKLAEESILENKMENSISLIHDNVLHLKNYFPGNNFDVVLCNPPYFKYHNENYVNDNKIKGIARHEIEISLEQLIEMASFLLKEKGRFYLVHVPDRLDEIFVFANKYKMNVKEIQLISSKAGEKPIIVLATIVKGSRFGCKVYPEISIGNCTTYQNLFKR